ncbi:MAG: SCO1664 family protein [Propionibacteriales bacterium]|nr:SCO1664 family protein [Propionibacteriales bacterium]
MVPTPTEACREHRFGELTLTGRLTQASNATFVATDDTGLTVVYKPVLGERELWDFPTGTLARREVAAHRVSALGGFDVVPWTTMVDGPLGEGSAQLWVETDELADEGCDILPADQVPEGWFPILLGEDADGAAVAVVHADDPRLRRIAVVDALINNADRKAGHILPAARHLYGCDHGVSFHTEPKLRTLLWGWAGQPLTSAEQAAVTAVVNGVDQLADLLSSAEIDALVARAEHLLADGMPEPGDTGPSVPWPLW